MRVRHSPWSWLNEIDPLDSVAGNTLIGMFTRLIFRKPFHVARAAIGLFYRRNRGTPKGVPCPSTSRPRALSRFVPLVVLAEIEAGAGEMNGMLRDLVAQQPPRGAVLVARHDETACKVAQP